MKPFATKLLPAMAAALLVLAGCKGVGEGRRPTQLQLTSAYGGDSADTYECVALQLTAYATFTGEGEDTLEAVSERATWVSNDTGVAIVSNGDIQIPGSSLYYAQGTVIVVGPGTATITADYAGLRAQYGISSTAIGELTITPQLTRLAPETAQTFELKTTTLESSVPVDLTDVAAWSVITAGAPVSSDGSTLQALTGPVDSPFALEAALPLCGRSARQEMSLGNLQSLQLSYEQAAGIPLPVGYSEYIGILGLFEDASAPPQELASQVVGEVLEGDEGAYSETLDTAGRLVRLLEADEPMRFRYTLESAGLSVDTRVLEARELDLMGLRLSTDEVELELRDSLQTEAFGRFSDGIERPVRHDLNWSSRSSTVASVASGIEGGKITAQSVEGDTVIDVAPTDLSGLSAEIAVHTYRKKPE